MQDPLAEMRGKCENVSLPFEAQGAGLPAHPISSRLSTLRDGVRVHVKARRANAITNEIDGMDLPARAVHIAFFHGWVCSFGRPGLQVGTRDKATTS